MVEKGVKGKSPERVKQIILEVASIHLTLHDRRLDFLRSKKAEKCHSEFLRELEEKIDLTDFQNWTRDQMVTTLFLTQVDIDVGKIVTEQLAKPELNMAELKAQVRNLEASPWYKGPKVTAKVAGGGAGGARGGQGATGRWCSVCERDTHDTSQCWGPCGNCGRYGHKQEACRNPKPEAKKLAEIAAAKKAKENKEKRERQKKKMAITKILCHRKNVRHSFKF